MKIEEIIKMPTTYIDKNGRDCHESLLRSYQLLDKVKEMLKRGDSQDTILEVVEYIERRER